MIDKDEFKKSPKFATLKAQVKAALKADPEYAKAIAERKEIRNWYKTMKQQFKEADEDMEQAEYEEEDAETMDEIDDAQDHYRDAYQLKAEADQAIIQAILDEAKVEDKMHSIKKKIIYNLISDPEEAEAVCLLLLKIR